MSCPSFLRLVALALLTVATPSMISAQDTSNTNATRSGYAESPDGLKLLITDVFSAIKSNNDHEVYSYFSGMALPEHTAWFAKTFGPAEGARMDAKYADLLPGLPEDLRGIFEYALKGNRTDPQVSVVEKGDTASTIGHAVLDAMQTPIPLYVASATNPKQKYGAAIGNFFYVDGAFRFVPTQVLQALSTAPPIRVRVGGNVQQAKLLTKVDPIYPATEAQGSVVLHVVIAVDGSVGDVTVVEGDPVLAKAAADAVRQWRYQPTLLNGTPVEVDTTSEIDFRRKPARK